MKIKRIYRNQQHLVSLFFATIILWSGNLSGQEKQLTEQIQKVSINSKALNEERIITVYLPDNYDMSVQKYPVLYLLDGRTHLKHAIGAVSFLANQGIAPQMIIVSIHNVDRNRDFSPVYSDRFPTSGGADKFLEFLDSELVPFIYKNFKASDFTILMGHSFGGTFTTYSLLSEPELFDGYIAISPFLQYADNYVVGQSGKLLKSKYKTHKYFYMTIGNEPDYFPALSEFEKAMQSKSVNVIDFEYEKMENENHGSIPYISLFKGLRFIFSDWQLPQNTLAAGLDAIDEHFLEISDKYGYDIKTPENIINILGYTYLQNKEIEKAIEIFKENVRRYPGSANVYDSLGEAYENNNQSGLAEENYKKATELGEKNNDPNFAVYKKNLERIQDK